MTEEGVAESADIVWRQIQAEHKNILAGATVPDPESSIEDAPMAIPLMPRVLTRSGGCQRLEVRRPATSAAEPAAGNAFPGNRTGLAVLKGEPNRPRQRTQKGHFPKFSGNLFITGDSEAGNASPRASGR